MIFWSVLLTTVGLAGEPVTIVPADAELEAARCGVFEHTERPAVVFVGNGACLGPSQADLAARIFRWHREVVAGRVDVRGPGRIDTSALVTLSPGACAAAVDRARMDGGTWVQVRPPERGPGVEVAYTGGCGRPTTSRHSGPTTVELESGVEGFTPERHTATSDRGTEPQTVELEYGVEAFVPARHLETGGGR